MRRVLMESPYRGSERDIARNLDYARACVRDCLIRDEAPIASHLLFTQPGILDDNIACDRNQGIMAGLVWLSVADAMALYCDLGISDGMKAAAVTARLKNVPVEIRWLWPAKKQI